MAETEKMWKWDAPAVFTSMYAGAILMIVAGIASTVYSHYGPAWTVPIMNGLATMAIVGSLFFSLRALAALPPVTRKITLKNAGSQVLLWLHKFHFKVQTTDEDGFDFSYIVTTDSGKIVTLKRHSRQFSDYITVGGYITLTQEEKDLVAAIDDDQAFEALYDIQMELLRARVGYNTTDVVNRGIMAFRRIPIGPNLSETEAINAIADMEAVISLVLLIKARKYRQLDRLRAK
jgi:hypothetical protein